MPLESVLTLLSMRMEVRARSCSARARSKCGVHAGDVVERLRDFDPARKDGDVGDEADIAHESIAVGPRVAAEDAEFAVEGREAEDGVQGGALAGAVGLMRPTIRPSSTRRSMLSSATDLP